jgi:hypothetical protein
LPNVFQSCLCVQPYPPAQSISEGGLLGTGLRRVRIDGAARHHVLQRPVLGERDHRPALLSDCELDVLRIARHDERRIRDLGCEQYDGEAARE